MPHARVRPVSPKYKNDSIFNLRVKGLLFTVQKALPLLPDGGSIILNASTVGSKGLPMNRVYSATRARTRPD